MQRIDMKFRLVYMNVARTVDLPVTSEELENWQKNRMTAGEAMPRLSQTQLNFITHGVYPDDSFFDSVEDLENVLDSCDRGTKVFQNIQF